MYQNNESLYNLILNNDNIEQEQLESLLMEVKEMNRKAILSKYNIQVLPSDGRFWVRMPDGKPVKKTHKEDLEEYIIQYETQKKRTLVSIFPAYLEDRKLDVKSTTWEKELFYFNTYLKSSQLGNKPIEDITIGDGHQFFRYVKTIKPDIRQKYWNNLHHSFINQIMMYAVQEGLINYNPLKELKIKKFNFTPSITKTDSEMVYSRDEKEAVIQLVINEYNSTHNPICLGILILFQTGIRVGELCGLQWGDIDANNRTLHIQRQYTKGVLSDPKTKTSNRILCLTDELLNLFIEIRNANQLNGYSVNDSDFVFLRKVKGEIIPCTDRCFNHRLECYCKKIGIKTKSCHDIRRTEITEMFENGFDTKLIQAIAGHSTQAMTEHYIKHRRQEDENIAMASISINIAWNKMEQKSEEKEKVVNPYK